MNDPIGQTPKTASDNYMKFTDQARRLFLTYDQGQIIERFSLDHDDSVIRLPFLGQPYEIDRQTGRVSRPGLPGGMEDSLTIYDILTRTPDRAPVLSGQWVTLSQLGGIIAAGHLQRLDRQACADYFDGKKVLLDAVCQRLGGSPQKQGDVSYILPVFPFYPIWLQFWEGDEEFPARLTYLWDKNTTEFLHYETQWYLMHFIEKRLMELAGELSGPD